MFKFLPCLRTRSHNTLQDLKVRGLSGRRQLQYTKRRIMLFLFLGLLLSTHSSYAAVGQHCDLGCAEGEHCVQNVCECDDQHTPRLYNRRISCRPAKEDCGPHQLCGIGEVCVDGDSCVCAPGKVMHLGECKTVSYRKIFQKCDDHFRDTVVCDPRDQIECGTNYTCLCMQAYWYNDTSSLCERKTDYMALHQLTEYRVGYGVYCTDEKECIEGLGCQQFKCSCPKNCEYDDEKEECICTVPWTKILRFVIPGAIIAVIVISILVYLGYRVREATRSDRNVPNRRPDALPRVELENGFVPERPGHLLDELGDQIDEMSKNYRK